MESFLVLPLYPLININSDARWENNNYKHVSPCKEWHVPLRKSFTLLNSDVSPFLQQWCLQGDLGLSQSFAPFQWYGCDRVHVTFESPENFIHLKYAHFSTLFLWNVHSIMLYSCWIYWRWRDWTSARLYNFHSLERIQRWSTYIRAEASLMIEGTNGKDEKKEERKEKVERGERKKDANPILWITEDDKGN